MYEESWTPLGLVVSVKREWVVEVWVCVADIVIGELLVTRCVSV